MESNTKQNASNTNATTDATIAKSAAITKYWQQFSTLRLTSRVISAIVTVVICGYAVTALFETPKPEDAAAAAKRNPLLFVWHPICAVLAFVCFLTEGLLHIRLKKLPIDSTPTTMPKKMRWHRDMHFYVFAAASLFSIISFVTVFVNKIIAGKDHFISWHAKLGLVVLFILNFNSLNGLLLQYKIPIPSITTLFGLKSKEQQQNSETNEEQPQPTTNYENGVRSRSRINSNESLNSQQPMDNTKSSEQGGKKKKSKVKKVHAILGILLVLLTTPTLVLGIQSNYFKRLADPLIIWTLTLVFVLIFVLQVLIFGKKPPKPKRN